MTNDEWKDKISRGETSTLQFKEMWSDNNAMAREMVAFANGKGGTIVFGVEDKTGQIKGLTYDEIQELSRKAGNTANENVLPTLYITTETIQIDGIYLLLVHIPKGINKPYKTLQGDIYVKQGSDKRRIKENTEILRMFHESGQYHPDKEGIVGTSVEDLNERIIDAYFERNFHRPKDAFGLTLDKLYKNMGLVNAKGEATLAGMLFFGNHPEWKLPQFIVKAVAFVGNELSGTQYRDSRDLEGTLPEVFDMAMNFCENNLHHIQAGQSFNSIGKLEVSRIALEELIQNALVHRLYIIDAPVRLLIFDNRIEIISPGCLPNNMTVEQIELGNSYPRNPLIANFCAKTMVYRGLGSGILRATNEGAHIEFINDEVNDKFTAIIYRDESEVLIEKDKVYFFIDKVQFEEFEVQKTGFKVQVLTDKVRNLRNKVQILVQTTQTITERKRQILETVMILISAEPSMTLQDLAKQMGVSLRSVKEYVDALQKANLLVREGSKKVGSWHINEDIN